MAPHYDITLWYLHLFLQALSVIMGPMVWTAVLSLLLASPSEGTGFVSARPDAHPWPWRAVTEEYGAGALRAGQCLR